MTIPSDPAVIENLKKIASLNKEAGDWQYTGIQELSITDRNKKPGSPGDILEQVKDVHLPKK